MHIILYYNILYSIVLYCIILYYIILYYIILYYIILYCIILYYIILYYNILYYIILYYIILYFILLYYIVLYYIIYICSFPLNPLNFPNHQFITTWISVKNPPGLSRFSATSQAATSVARPPEKQNLPSDGIGSLQHLAASPKGCPVGGWLDHGSRKITTSSWWLSFNPPEKYHIVKLDHETPFVGWK